MDDLGGQSKVVDYKGMLKHMSQYYLSIEAQCISGIIPVAAADAAEAARRLRCVWPAATSDGLTTASIGRRCAPDDTVVDL